MTYKQLLVAILLAAAAIFVATASEPPTPEIATRLRNVGFLVEASPERDTYVGELLGDGLRDTVRATAMVTYDAGTGAVFEGQGLVDPFSAPPGPLSLEERNKEMVVHVDRVEFFDAASGDWIGSTTL
jgi:hypothetical protein